MADAHSRPARGSAKGSEEESVRRWIARCLDESPPFTDAQLRQMGEILGVRFSRKNAKPA